jgi:hypothetical protein
MAPGEGMAVSGAAALNDAFRSDGDGGQENQLVLSGLYRMARRLPFVEAAEERTRVRDPELSKRERRTGARFLRLSTAVRHNRFAQAS